MREYVICVDLEKGSNMANVKIHLDRCQHHRNRKINPKTMKWLGGFKTREQAESQAKYLSTQYGRWRHSQNCV